MSRFFQGGLSDSDYSSSEEELLSSSDEELLNSSDEDDFSEDSEFANDDDDDQDDSDSDSDDDRQGPSYFLKKSFVKDESDDDSDDDRKVVKSSKDKLLDEIRGAITIIDSSKVINEWDSVLSEFDKLNRLLVRAAQQSVSIPNLFIKSLVALDETVTEFNNDPERKKLNASMSKAFNTVRQRVKKTVREQEKLVQAYADHPEAFEKDEGSYSPPTSTGVEDEEEAPVKPGKTIHTAGIFRVLRSVIESRGKKNVDTNEQISQLEEAVELATTPYEFISLYLRLIPLRFDSGANVGLSLQQFNATAKDINSLFEVLEKNKATYAVLETAKASDDIEIEPTPNASGVVEILGSVVSFVERLDDEFTRSLQQIDPHTTEYVDRLSDEQLIYNTIVRAQLYSEAFIPQADVSKPTSDQLARIIARRIEHIYFKPASLISLSESKAWESLSFVSQKSYVVEFSTAADYTDKLLDGLSSVLYKQTTSTYRKRAMLSHIYYYAFNNKYYKARDMFLMSHLQSTIHSSDTGIQILFNRCLVQLGLCAFRNGLIQDAHQNLFEIATSQNLRELLGQNYQRYNNQQQPQANYSIDKRQLPYHTHVNIDLLEAVYLTSALLLEIPQYASGALDDSKQKQAKTFAKYLEGHERHYFQGPPETTKDYIMHSAKALQKGNWKKATELLTSVKVWNFFPEAECLRNQIREHVQIEGLRTYLFQFKTFYSKLSISKLSQIFELPESKVSAVISKMIFNEEISGGLDQVSNTIIFTKGVQLTKLQQLALSLADKSVQMSERNERLAQQSNNSYNGASYSSQRGQNQRHHQNKNNSNLKFAPVTGALSSAPGSISGALNGMDKRQRKTTHA